MSEKAKIPERRELAPEDTWDLSKLFQDDTAWKKGLAEFEAMIPKIESYKGTLGQGAEQLRSFLDFMNEVGILEERLGYYAQLRYSENGGDSSHQAKVARYMQAASKAETAGSFIRPELLSIPDDKMETFLASPELEEFQIYLKKILRFKPHTLPEREERILAMQIESNQTAGKAFSALSDVDLDFGTVETPEGAKPLSQGSFSFFMIHPDRGVRERAYRQFYGVFDGHKNTFAALYGGSVHLDIYHARVREYPSARAMALFPDKVPERVYDQLIEEVHGRFDTLHRYYRLRRKVLGLDSLRHYDVYVPLVENITVNYPYEEAVDLVIEALSPLGEEYTTTLRQGLLGRWVDRYENKGKRSGAFSAGSYAGAPYILLNYKPEVMRNLFTLAHEAGHSMHSFYSTLSNPFQHYSYTIFEAEVASTVNEQLLADYMKKNADSEEMRVYLIGKEVDDIIATIFRQTMFAEFEHKAHTLVEGGEPLTVDSVRRLYRSLLTAYFGDEMELEERSDLEALRIPHFYNAFYVYKYATGLSAAITLARGLLGDDGAGKEQYIEFFRSGGSHYPLESLALAGVDMQSPEPVAAALDRFAVLVGELEKALL